MMFKKAVGDQKKMIVKMQQRFIVRQTKAMILKSMGGPKDADSDEIQTRRAQLQSEIEAIIKFISFELSKMVRDSGYQFDDAEKLWENVDQHIVLLTYDTFLAQEKARKKPKITKPTSPSKISSEIPYNPPLTMKSPSKPNQGKT